VEGLDTGFGRGLQVLSRAHRLVAPEA
jgi:hypothetical protein